MKESLTKIHIFLALCSVGVLGAVGAKSFVSSAPPSDIAPATPDLPSARANKKSGNGGKNIKNNAPRSKEDKPKAAPAPAAPSAQAVALAMRDTMRDVPQGALFQAWESAADGGVADDSALGGRAATSTGAWQSLLDVPLPKPREGEPNGFTVWLRHRGGPILLKSRKGDSQSDLAWIWDAPEKWKWTALGPFSREQIGQGVLAIRGSPDAAQPFLDALVLAPIAMRELPPERPNPDLPALRLQPTVEWSQISHPLRRELWGVNDYEILDPKAARDAQFQSHLKQMSPAIVRIHQGGISDAWTDEKTRAWNRDKIVAGFRASTGYDGARIMLNIARPPAWLTREAVLSEAQEDEWAAQMADLARILKDENIRVEYWELTNEMEGAYEKAGRLGDLWRLLNKCLRAVKAADPSVKVGGPALTWPKPEWVEGLLLACGPNLDFVTWHNYASGDIHDSNEHVLARARAIADMARGVVEAAKRLVPNKKLEVFLSEYNIKWVWEPIERRHGNSIGALFQASTLARLAPLGLDGVTVWHAKGGAYGLIDGDNTLRSTGALYRWSQYLSGQVARSSTPDEEALEVLPIVRQDGKKSLLLLAKAGQNIVIPDARPLGKTQWTAQRIDADGLHLKVEVPTRGEWTLPGYSLTLLLER